MRNKLKFKRKLFTVEEQFNLTISIVIVFATIFMSYVHNITVPEVILFNIITYFVINIKWVDRHITYIKKNLFDEEEIIINK